MIRYLEFCYRNFNLAIKVLRIPATQAFRVYRPTLEGYKDFKRAKIDSQKYAELEKASWNKKPPFTVK